MTAFWLDTVRERLGAGGDLVSVIVATAEGSAPREPGAWMLVDGAGQTGTIGGGRLEWEAARTAREMLAAPAGPWRRDLRDYPLGRTWSSAAAASCGCSTSGSARKNSRDCRQTRLPAAFSCIPFRAGRPWVSSPTAARQRRCPCRQPEPQPKCCPDKRRARPC